MALKITPAAIQELLDELERSQQSRKRAWEVLQQLRTILCREAHVSIPSPAAKSFEAEGEVLCFALAAAIRNRNEVVIRLIAAAESYKKAVEQIEGSRPTQYPGAHLQLLKALGHARELVEP
jgi:hypothetical protein